MAHDICILMKIERQKSQNWCWLAVALAIAKQIDSACSWTQERILFEAAKQGKDEGRKGWDQDRIDNVQYGLLNDDGTSKYQASADIMKMTVTDWRGPLELSMGSVGCLGTKHKIADFPVNQLAFFEFVTEEVRLGHPLVAHLTYTTAVGGGSAGVTHALLIVGSKETATREKSIYWMDPGPQKTALGTINCTLEPEFWKLQGKADLSGVTATKSSVKACPKFQRV